MHASGMSCGSESSVTVPNSEMKAPNGLGNVVSSAQSAAVLICMVAHTICAEMQSQGEVLRSALEIGTP